MLNNTKHVDNKSGWSHDNKVHLWHNIHFFLFCILTEMLSSYAVPHRHQKIFKNRCLQSFKLNIEKSCWLCKARFTAYPNLASKHKLSNSFKTADTWMLRSRLLLHQRAPAPIGKGWKRKQEKREAA